jgi:hypothetical protein
MKNKDIYTSAINLLAQNADENINEDYEERAPYLIASFCNEISEMDSAVRKALGIEKGSCFDRVWIDLEEDFPMLDRFVSAAIKYLAAMLVIDEDGDLSDKLYEMYCDGISKIRSQIPCILEKTANRYS